MRRTFLTLIALTFFSSAAFPAALSVKVKNGAGNPLAGAMVAVIAFSNTGGTGEPDGTRSSVGYSGSDGFAYFFIEPNYDYNVYVTSHGMSPTIKSQMNNPAYTPVRTTGYGMVVERYLLPDPVLATGAGRIQLFVTGVSSCAMLFADVKHITSGEPVAFSAVKAPAGASPDAALVIPNVPAAAAGSYRVSVGIPERNVGYEILVSTPVLAGQTVNMTISSSAFQSAGMVDRQDEIAGEISFEGNVADEDGIPLKDCVVTMKKKNPDVTTGWVWDQALEVAEVRTDFSGHFAFYDVAMDTYAFAVARKGYRGTFITWGPNGEGRVPGRPGDRWVSEYTSGRIVLPKAVGKIRGVVKMYPNIPVPDATIDLHEDWSMWQTVPNNVPTANDGGYNNYYTNDGARSAKGWASTRTGADGSFEIDGLTQGNYVLNIWSEFGNKSSGYSFNRGADQQDDFDGSGRHTDDDLRITVSTSSVNPGTPDEFWKSSIYKANALGEVYQDCVSTNPFVVFIGTATAQPGTITGTITFDSPQESVSLTTAPVLIVANEQSNSGSGKMFYTALTGTLAGKTTSYTIFVSTGTMYWVYVQSNRWGIVGNRDMNIDMTAKNDVTGLDLRLAPAGRIKGIVRLPDGSVFKRRSNTEYSDAIRIQAQGTTVNCNNSADVQENGYFEISGLIPGTYNLGTLNYRENYANGSRVPLEWPNGEMTGVKVREDLQTYVEIQLKTGALVAPKTPSMPPIAAPPAPYTQPYTSYVIMKFPSATGTTRDSLTALMGGPEGLMQAIEFQYDPASPDPWRQKRILPGRYDFLLSRADLFSGGKGGGDQQPSDHFCLTFISQLKNVEVMYDPLNPGATSYLEFESGTLGQSVLKGKVSGGSIFTQKDVDIITTSGMDKFLSYIPSVMLYDAAGQLKAFSMALPSMERIEEWNQRIKASSFTLDWFRSELARYPVSYRIERLPAGDYVAVFETPNYPPMMKKVRLTTGENTLDVSFDDNVITGSSVAGVVKSTDSVMLADATVILVHKTVTKTLQSDGQGAFSISGLPPGTYRMTVNKPGFATAAERFQLGRDPVLFLDGNAITMQRANATIEGTVFSQKMPTPKIIVGARVVAYNESYNTAYPGKMLPVVSVKTDEQGRYVLDGIIAGNVYKVHVLAPGKLLEWRTLGTGTAPINPGANTGVDFVLKSLPPRLKVTMAKIYENGRFLYKFLIESPKRIINPSNPTSLAAPYCRYSPVSSPSEAFNADASVEVLPNIGAEIADPNGGKVYSYSLKIPVVEDSEFYKLRIEATDGSVNYTEDVVFGPKIEAKAKKDVKEEIAEGGDISLDDTGNDTTRITVDAGALTPTQAETTSVTQNDATVPIGGFLSAMPNFNLSRTGSLRSAAMARIVDSIIASDVYEVALNDAQLNKSLSLNLKFDMTKVSDADLARLAICRFNPSSGSWERMAGAMTVDPISGVVSVDVDSLNTGSSTRAPSAGRAAIRNGMFAVDRAAATSQSGVYAVFKQDPNTAKAFTGGEFVVYNFPNPFDLAQKNVHLADVNSEFDQSVKGTVIKYALPASRSGRVRFFIYNLAGELVKEIDEGTKNGGYYYYVEWDGTNDNGEDCASGVYLLIAKLDGKKVGAKPLKMAILK